MSLRDRLLDARGLLAYHKAYRRLGQVSQGEVIDWANTSIWGVQAALENGDLESVKLGAIGLLAAADTLLDTSQ